MKRLILLLMGILTCCGIGLTASLAMADDDRPPDAATVSFGQWRTDFDPPLDRVTTPVPPMGVGNNHELLPKRVTIKEGGAVNFIISGLHTPIIYDHRKPGEISVMSPLPGAAGGIINDDNNRIYRGLDPNTVPPVPNRDRVEVVHFPNPGTYLVICGVVNHFVNDRMFGFVEVEKDKHRR
jgi:hypothetical protein